MVGKAHETSSQNQGKWAFETITSITTEKKDVKRISKRVKVRIVQEKVGYFGDGSVG